MIASGEKKEEYREIKNYWIKRLYKGEHFKHFDNILFRNGHRKNAPEILIEFKGIGVMSGKIEWGAKKGEQYFNISLGKIIKISNYENT